VLGRFNMHMAHALLIFCDEIVWGGNKKDEGVLKGLVTETDRLVEGKFQNPLTLPSYLRMIFATNEAWAVPTGEKERRWCVLNVNNNHIQDTEYFRALKAEMANGGVEALMDFLLARDLTYFDVRRVPKTQGLLEQKLMSQDSVATWWYDRLSQGEFGCSPDRYYIEPCLEFGSFNQTHQILNEYLQSVKYDRYGHGRVINGQQLISSLKRMCDVEPGREQVDGRRRRGVYLPPLADCRTQYEAFIGHATDWPE
ncbi:MAG: primase-helicase family protein, partial [Betaproteobacteria bacterium]